MKRHYLPATCTVCGGEGDLPLEHAGQDWLYPVQHENPEICADNLRQQRLALEREKKLLAEERAKPAA